MWDVEDCKFLGYDAMQSGRSIASVIRAALIYDDDGQSTRTRLHGVTPRRLQSTLAWNVFSTL
jgi:hypothetical protein